MGSRKISNGKRKGSGNTKNGNKYLAWAFVEAANFAIRFSSRIKGFYQKKKSKSHTIVAIKAVAQQALPGLLLHNERSGSVCYHQGVCLTEKFNGWDGIVSPGTDWLRTTWSDWPLSRP